MAEGLCEWIPRGGDQVPATRAAYPLRLFRRSVAYLQKTRNWIESHDDNPHSSLVKEGSVALLHGEMHIRSLLWYPFFFRDDGYYLLALNQVHRRREWKPEEFVFLDAVTRQVNLALQKLALLDELQQAQSRLVRRERLAAVGQLSAGIAHDFNNILTAILGVTELLEQREDLPRDVGEHLRLVSTSGRRAARLVRQLLDFSRRTVRRTRALDLRELCGETVTFLERTLPETIDVEFRPSNDEVLVEGDRVQIQEVLTNLAVNARDAMPMGGKIELGVELEPSVEGVTCTICGSPVRGEWVRLLCRDSGTGIPRAQHRTHLRAVFLDQASRGRRRAGPGPGGRHRGTAWRTPRGFE
ncbi:MAG: histidine kinase dimerization/phospho-acceptor domain-containing protein [Acidobacteriota bacterium]|nr:histidine kinase dimerization/phospho-acceptor domain-containing protein [Acidobacteriota bacterium]